MQQIRTLATVVALVGVAATAHAITLETSPVVPHPDGWVLCVVENVYDRTLDIRATIVDEAGRNVSDYFYTEWLDSEGTTLDRLVAGSSHPEARSCEVRVKGGGRRHVVAWLEVYDPADPENPVVIDAE